MRLKNSPEYQILFYLDTHQSDNEIDVALLSRVLTSATEHEIKTTIPILIGNKYVRYRENQIGLAITEQGQKRRGKMKTDIDIESLSQRTAKLSKSTNLLAWATFGATLMGAIGVFLQCYYANEENTILRAEGQDSIKERTLLLKADSSTIHIDFSKDTFIVKTLKTK